MSNRSTRTALTGAFIAGMTVLAGCSGEASSSSEGGGDSGGDAPSQFRVGVFGPDVTFAAFYGAIGEDGELTKLLDEAGTELTIEQIPSGSNLVAALAGGSVDAAIVPGSAVLGVSAQGGALVPLMSMFNGPSQQIIASTAVEQANGDDVAAFEDGRWAFTRVGSISEITLKTAAEDAGLTWEELERIPLGSGSETQAVLESDRADILSTSPNNAAHAVASGEAYLIANPQADESNIVANQLNAIFAGSPDFVAENPDFTQDVVTALISELSELAEASSAGDVLEGMAPEFQEAVSDTWDLQWEYSATGFSRASGGFSQDEVDQTIAGAQLVAVVPDGFSPPADLFDNTRVVAAYEELGIDLPAGLE